MQVFCLASLLTLAAAAPASLSATYDYVIVGGGTAGLTIAVRLAENPSLNIAIVEAGDFYENVNGNNSAVPGYDVFASVAGVTDWGLITTPQPTLNNRTLAYDSAKVVGGSSMTNLMAFHRSTVDAFALWAKTVGDDSYTWDNIEAYYKKPAKYVPPNTKLRAANASVPTVPPTTYSAEGGPLEATFPNFAYAGASYLGPAFEELGVAELENLWSGELIGWQYSPFAISSDQQRSGATQYLKYATARGFKNLKLYKTTLAKKILFNGNKTATGVVVEVNGTSFTLGAKREVIVSSGVFRSPQLLLVSGIGPSALLKANNIPVIADRPGVGQNLQDHPFINIVNKVSIPTGSRLLDPSIALAEETDYKTNRTGMYTNPNADSFGWVKLPPSYVANMSAAAQAHLASYPADWPDIEIVLVEAAFAAGADYLMASCQVQSFISTGTVTINSSDTSNPPILNTNTIGNPIDHDIALGSLKYMRAFFSTASFNRINIEDVVPGAAVQTDEEMLEWLYANIGTGFHGTSTCSMGKSTDPKAVVDSHGSVIGVNRLRVMDASAFPFVPPGHPTALVYALAEKIADDIKAGL
ncbi:putative glucose-methanol-choline oxidoreductase [Mollisia scopiformis]|uniref:Putative glucose-methanol-choline oxidoreductase n=1 Tax=Mollisia scopiformis TaxID=149040 RepID=A0A194XU39_MOLSC|nr:putative glucose-methanol-choline oxidoreductase [Mollisia scopiformis]KUJ23222.1 putative glucose-methanol-choline oxidoreductase [Mollisia scopiformis]